MLTTFINSIIFKKMTEFKLIYTVTYSCDESGDTTVPLHYHSYQETAMFEDKETAMDFYSQCIGQRDFREVQVSYDDLCKASLNDIDVDKLNY